MKKKHLLWILNGCGMEANGITGGPVRFHEISRRWLMLCPDIKQHLITTPGGEGMLRGMGCKLPSSNVRASLFAKREIFLPSRLWSYVLSACSGKWLVRRLPPADIIITVSDYFCDVVPAMEMKRRWPGCRWIAWIHHRELPPAERPGNRLVNTLTWKMQEWSLRQIARHADAAWVYDTEAGDRVRERLLAFGMAPQRIHLMKCGINRSAIAGAPETEKRVDAVMVGVRPNKGRFDILPIWEKVIKLRPGTTLRLMGGISEREALVEMIRRKGLDNPISLLSSKDGFLPQSEYYARLKDARVLFAPSHEEGWGMAVCEAMAAGLPVIAYDLPVYRRIYGTAFAAVPCHDHAAFAETLVRLLDNPDAFGRFQAAGLDAAAPYDWDAIANADYQKLQHSDDRDADVPEVPSLDDCSACAVPPDAKPPKPLTSHLPFSNKYATIFKQKPTLTRHVDHPTNRKNSSWPQFERSCLMPPPSDLMALRCAGNRMANGKRGRSRTT